MGLQNQVNYFLSGSKSVLHKVGDLGVIRGS